LEERGDSDPLAKEWRVGKKTQVSCSPVAAERGKGRLKGNVREGVEQGGESRKSSTTSGRASGVKGKEDASKKNQLAERSSV